MTTDPATEAIKALKSGPSPNTSRSARIAELMPHIHEALARGSTIKLICEALNKSDIKISVRTLFRHVAKHKLSNPIPQNAEKPGLQIKESKKNREPATVVQKSGSRNDPKTLKDAISGEVDLSSLENLGKSK